MNVERAKRSSSRSTQKTINAASLDRPTYKRRRLLPRKYSTIIAYANSDLEQNSLSSRSPS